MYNSYEVDFNSVLNARQWFAFLQAFIFQVKDPIVNISSFSHCVLTGLQQKPLITGL